MVWGNYRFFIKGRVSTLVCIMTWRREALKAASSFGYVPLVIWFVAHWVLEMSLFTHKLCCQATITSSAPDTHMSLSVVSQSPKPSIFQRISLVGIPIRTHHFISINHIFTNSHILEGIRVFHWVIRIHHPPTLFSACMLEVCSVWNVVTVPVPKLGNVMRMLLPSSTIAKTFVKHVHIVWFQTNGVASGSKFYKF